MAPVPNRTEAIDRLVASRLAMVDDEERVRYVPATAELSRRVAALEIEYQRAPTTVRRLILQTSDPAKAPAADPPIEIHRAAGKGN
jgi:hypothetical protein